MLVLILNEYKKPGGAVSLDVLSRKLGVEKSALEGMLETLVRQGKLKEIPAPSASCGSCHGAACSGCGLNKIFANMGKTYQLVV